jgi:glycyl-tRNA synthetase beta chain
MDAEIAAAVEGHYKPQGPSDAVPTAPVSIAVALADKLDTLAGFFSIDEKPTGSKDPYALRRAALGVIRIILENGLRVPLASTLRKALHIISEVADGFTGGGPEVAPEIVTFFADRLKVTLRDQGKRHDLVDAVFALGDDDLARIVARVEALDGFLKTDDGKNLLAGYKRASNILKAEEKKGALPTGVPEAPTADSDAEVGLYNALRLLDKPLKDALAKEDFTGAMTQLAELRGPVDAYLDGVFVNEPEHRDNRLKTLAAVRDAMGQVADFGLIAG